MNASCKTSMMTIKTINNYLLILSVSFVLEMGKNPQFWFHVRFRFSDDKGSVLFGFWVLKKN